MSLELARRVGPNGAVVGIDMDATVLERAATDAHAAGISNVEFRAGDAGEVGGGPYDVAYARFLLSHVGDPVAVLGGMVGAVRPGGVVVVEDTDFTGSFCHPPSAPFERWIALLPRDPVAPGWRRRRGEGVAIAPRRSRTNTRGDQHPPALARGRREAAAGADDRPHRRCRVE